MPKILMVSPVMRDRSNGRARFFTRSLQSIYALDWSERLDFLQLVGDDNYTDVGETVTRKYGAARATFLAGEWDYLFTVETDMIIPPDTLTRLLACEADIAYGLYVFRHLSHREWSPAATIREKQWRSFSKDATLARQSWGQVVDVKGVGMGCTLIKRKVIEALPFRFWRGVACDWALACDAQDAGFSQRCDLGCICGHMTLIPSPQTYWPDPNEEKLVRVEFPA